MKKEELEKAAEYNYPDGDVWTEEQAIVRRLAFRNGANYMAERMYSEEEVRELIIKALTHNDHNLCGSLVARDYVIREANFSVWFEENKKK
jgi:hypothetical protein